MTPGARPKHGCGSRQNAKAMPTVLASWAPLTTRTHTMHTVLLQGHGSQHAAVLAHAASSAMPATP